jgi:hypothetical protein
MTSLPTLQRRLCPIIGLVALFVATPSMQARGAPERYTALAVNMGSPVRWTSLSVEMVVNRWSSDAECARLLSILLEKGPAKLLDELRNMPRVGYIRTPDSVGYDLRFAQKTQGEDGGERVVLSTDRYISFWEAVNRPRTIDYPFTVIELRLGPNREGEGKMTLFTRIVPDKMKNTIVLEDYGTQPVLLQAVKKSAPH